MLRVLEDANATVVFDPMPRQVDVRRCSPPPGLLQALTEVHTAVPDSGPGVGSDAKSGCFRYLRDHLRCAGSVQNSRHEQDLPCSRALPTASPDDCHHQLDIIPATRVRGHDLAMPAHVVAPVHTQRSKNLRTRISASMTDKSVTHAQCSAPDARGARRHKSDQWRTDQTQPEGHVGLRQLAGRSNAVLAEDQAAGIGICSQDGPLQQQGLHHRSTLLNTDGLSGGEVILSQRTDEQIIMQVFGMNAATVKKYLAQYCFEKTGLYSQRVFVRFIESYQEPPRWAAALRRSQEPGTHADAASAVTRLVGSSIHAAIYAVAPCEPAQRISGSLKLGDRLSAGISGIVFLDSEDTQFVIKRLRQCGWRKNSSGQVEKKLLSFETRWHLALQEAINFRSYYGPGAAEVLADDADVYIRMFRIPGRELAYWQLGSLPSDASEKFMQMVCRLSQCGMWNDDLHEQNIFYCDELESFFPIDFNGRMAQYLGYDAVKKQSINESDCRSWNDLIRFIQIRQARRQRLN